MTEWWVDDSEIKGKQSEVLDVDLDRDVGVFGPPGSGKTNLMMLRANHLHIASNPEFYVVTYTSLLAKFIRRGANRYSFPANKVITQTKLFENVLGDHGKNLERIDGEKFKDYQARLFAEISLLMEAGEAKHAFPALFIDEGQDYSPSQLAVFRHLARNVCIAADVRQGIHGAVPGASEYIQEFCDPVVTLIHHFRTGREILKVADRIMYGKFGHTPMLDTSQYPEATQKSTVTLIDACPLNDQIDQAIERLKKQLDVYPNELLGVLVPTTAILNSVWERMNSAPALSGKITNAKDTRNFDPACPVWLATIHSAKGLEFRCVHLLSAEHISRFNALARRLAFTAVTRAKTVLVVYHFDDLLPFLSSALNPVAIKKVARSELFGSKK
jgi:superfamily I DNA/RNA helicase